jgi:hypothetical protein
MELGQKTARCESLRALFPYVEWDRFVTLAGSKSGLRVTLSYLPDHLTRIILRPLSLDEVNIAKRIITTGLLGLPDHRAEWTSLVCNICNKHNVPVSISYGKRTQYNIRDEIVVPISFCSLQKLHLFPQTSWNWQKRAVFINYSGSNKKWIDRFLL